MADRARCILLIFWHATLSPLPGVHLSSPALSTFKIFPVAAPSPRKLLGYPSSSCACEGPARTFSSFNSLARSLSSPPLCRPFLSVSFLSFSCIHIGAYTTVSRRASSSTSVLLLRLPCSVFRSPRESPSCAPGYLAATLFFCPVRSRLPSVRPSVRRAD